MSLHLLATSDLHGHLHAAVSHLSAYAKRLTDNGEDVIIVDCGDLLTDSAEGWYVRNNPHMLRSLISRGGYDALLPGNHDLMLPATILPQPSTACNVSGIPSLLPYILLHRGGQSIAITGAVTDTGTSHPDGIAVSDPAKCLRRTAAHVTSLHHPDIIVALIHADAEETEAILLRNPQIQLAVYGHDHLAAIHTLSQDGRISVNPGRNGARIAHCIINPDGAIEASLIPLPDDTPPLPSDLLRCINTSRTPPCTAQELTTMLHVRLHAVTGAEITLLPQIEFSGRISPTPAAIYSLLPYDDYPATALLTGQEISTRPLSIMTHGEATALPLDPSRTYKVCGDSHTLPHSTITSDTSIQSILLTFHSTDTSADKDCRIP